MGEHLLIDIFTMEITFFGNPYCLIKMVYCKDGFNGLHVFYIIAGRKCLHFNEDMRIQNAKLGDFSIEVTHSI